MTLQHPHQQRAFRFRDGLWFVGQALTDLWRYRTLVACIIGIWMLGLAIIFALLGLVIGTLVSPDGIGFSAGVFGAEADRVQEYWLFWTETFLQVFILCFAVSLLQVFWMRCLSGPPSPFRQWGKPSLWLMCLIILTVILPLLTEILLTEILLALWESSNLAPASTAADPDAGEAMRQIQTIPGWIKHPAIIWARDLVLAWLSVFALLLASAKIMAWVLLRRVSWRDALARGWMARRLVAGAAVGLTMFGEVGVWAGDAMLSLHSMFGGQGTGILTTYVARILPIGVFTVATSGYISRMESQIRARSTPGD